MLAALCAFAAGRAQAQTATDGAPSGQEVDADAPAVAVEVHAGAVEEVPVEEVPVEEAPVEEVPVEEAAARPPADAAEAPAEAAPSAPPAPRLDDERPPAAALGAPAAAEEPLPWASVPERLRDWRLPREHVRRPLTLPQGVLRFDSTVALSLTPHGLGGRLYLSGHAAAAAGLLDDLEIGATPLGITWIPLGLHFSDPYLYARARALSGDTQIAFRAGATIPVSQTAARMELAVELAFLVADWLRVDTGVEYALLFSSPLHQRVGVPVIATAQLGRLQSLAVTLGVYVFNDFDDVDVPLLLRYAITFRGYQGPLGEYSIEGGFTDLENAFNAWTIQSRFTWFAYL